ncbi:DBH-like monooxygenase protein 1 [Orchesella cincta]|uniref:DBH-like monooxygenase protein 1 n=1 Tax=Orchesella cincta TaxID=48709 RepID=A0A1D2MDA9_ORCCI|nr:DBH-like monooxygenase protein 1 [Orchesella cincta]
MVQEKSRNTAYDSPYTRCQSRAISGFGFSSTGTKWLEQICNGGVDDDGRPIFKDYHAIRNEVPVEDPSQDWTLIEASETGNSTTLRFSRPFDSCDSDHDIPITRDVLSLLWTYSESDDVTQYHFASRGSYEAYLLDPDLTPRGADVEYRRRHPEAAQGLQKLEFQRTKRLPGQDTLYWCTFQKLPFTEKKHIIGFQTVFPDRANFSHVHHMILHRCRAPPGMTQDEFFRGPSESEGTECYILDQPNQSPVPYCREVTHVYGIGGRAIFFPEDVGIAMQEIEDEYWMLQIHYDNPNNSTNLDVTVSLEAYYTDELRENEAGVLQMGDMQPGAHSIMIPPGSINHVIHGHCAPGCTDRILGEVSENGEGVTMFATFLHTHMSGIGVRLMQFRDGQEMPWINYDDNYDFNFQQFRVLREPRQILPKDHILYRCVYDSTDRDGTAITGGFSTREEMCTAFTYYYKASRGFALCRSETRSAAYMNHLGISNYTWQRPIRQMVVTAPEQYAGLTMRDYVNNHIDWTIDYRRELQRLQIYEPQVTQCPRFYWEDGRDFTGPGSDGNTYTSVDPGYEHESTMPRVPRWQRPEQCVAPGSSTRRK